MSDPRMSSSIFTRGAVDLGALRTPPPAPATGPGPEAGGVPSPGGDAMIIDVTEATFQTEVIERSLTTPVVIDFWADWCQPCRQLTPVLEKLAREGNGSWVLARINVDENQRIAATFRVQSIPLVYAVIGGQPVDAFNGVIPEPQLRQWIGAVLTAGGTAVEEPADPRFEDADNALMTGDLDAAEKAYKQILADVPGRKRGRGRAGPGRPVPPGRWVRTRPRCWPPPTRRRMTPRPRRWPPTSRWFPVTPRRRTTGWSNLVRRSSGPERDAISDAPGVPVHHRRSR